MKKPSLVLHSPTMSSGLAANVGGVGEGAMVGGGSTVGAGSIVGGGSGDGAAHPVTNRSVTTKSVFFI